MKKLMMKCFAKSRLALAFATIVSLAGCGAGTYVGAAHPPASGSGTSTTPAPGTYLLDPEQTIVRANTRAMFGLLKVKGILRLTSGQVIITADPAGSSATATIAAGSFVSGALRNPEAAPRVFGNVLLGFALTEAVALFALVIAFMILFVF